ncbi:MAG: homoserine O-acetyltransferase [Williamsia sp.]|nr:homoserine O-acetyltransferase [Williamsia sp.]
MNQFHCNEPFQLEGGELLHGITIAYNTYGQLNSDRSNVVWVCHALTANSEVTAWWPGMVGEGHVIDPERYFVVCANILGSCYGTTGPLSKDLTGQPYYHRFPLITIRDMVKAHLLLCRHLQIEKIFLLMGGSMGGYQVLEWAVMEPAMIQRIFLIATSASESAWGIAVHTTQRLAIEADGTWLHETEKAGSKGLKAARAVGMLSYRNYGILVQKQTDEDKEKLDHYRASSYMQYQGDKLVKRFNAYSYWLLTKSMDTHHLGRGRGKSLEGVLKTILQPTLVIGISSDILCPVVEQQYLAHHIIGSTYAEIDSIYGHDGFIIESATISYHLQRWLQAGMP